MKTKHAIILWLIGFIITIICDLFAIMNWPFAFVISILSIIGFLLRITGFIVFIYKFHKYSDKKEILNS